MAVEKLTISSSDKLFRRGIRAGRDMSGKPYWPVTVFRIPFAEESSAQR
jgi:hypothetical protein